MSDFCEKHRRDGIVQMTPRERAEAIDKFYQQDPKGIRGENMRIAFVSNCIQQAVEEAGNIRYIEGMNKQNDVNKHIVEEAIAAERERILKIIESSDADKWPYEIAKAIRDGG